MDLWGRLPHPGQGAIVGGRPSAPESQQRASESGNLKGEKETQTLDARLR